MMMKHPWKEIDLTDYESHMQLDSVYQLQTLNAMMKDQFVSCEAESVMILGIAGGNGLEHIDGAKYRRVYGVDINQNYLNECSKRYPKLSDLFTPICADLTDSRLSLPCAELLIANLLIEYIGYDCFQAVVRQVKPRYISCIIQINTETSFVSDSPYLHAFDRLSEVHHQMEEYQLTHAMERIGYSKGFREARPLPNGKQLLRLDYFQYPAT